ncbi:MAG: peptide ABC transporter substrate-binding protein [Cyanothece sp. SIO1E1]|nr:peptide ABC transporter substrate-binding protein [Cyanothece sp. SIO1E1]
MILSSIFSGLAQSIGWRNQYSFWDGVNRFRWQQWRSLGQFIGLFSLCLFLTASCGDRTSPPSNVSTGADTDNNRITMGTTLKARTLDPADAYEIFPGILLHNLGDRLYTYKPSTTELTPQLATALPQVSENGLVYTIPLREDVVFHDDTPFNAKAMAFSLQRLIENGGRPAFLLAEKVDSIEATGDYEITIRLKAPFAAFPALLTFWGTTPISPAAYQIGSGQFMPNTFVGTGPYTLAEFGTDTIRLDVNTAYWGEPPQNDGVDIQLFADSPANLFNTFRTGGIDVAYQTLDPDQIRSLETESSQGGWQVIEAGSTVINYMTLNQKQEPFDQLAVRQAVAAMIDRKLLNERVFQGQAEPLYSLIPTSFEIYEPVFLDRYGDGDVEKAKAFLATAGFSADNPFTLELWYPSASTVRNLVSTALKASIEQKLGDIVKVEINNVEGATAWQNLEKGIYPTFFLNWYPDFYDADTFIQPFMDCDQGSKQTGCEIGSSQSSGSFYYSDRAIELIEQQRAEQDPEARNAILKELQELLAEDVPYIPLWQDKDYIFAQKGLQGVEIQPTQQLLLWQISKS